MTSSVLKSLGLRSVIVLGLILVSPCLKAQVSGGVPAELEPREAIGAILMSGLVGGILGLSTLSFYDKPQDNIRNISIGAGVGMIAAALYLTYNVSQIAPPAGVGVFESTEKGSEWALLPDWDPKSSQARASYVLRF